MVCRSDERISKLHERGNPVHAEVPTKTPRKRKILFSLRKHFFHRRRTIKKQFLSLNQPHVRFSHDLDAQSQPLKLQPSWNRVFKKISAFNNSLASILLPFTRRDNNFEWNYSFCTSFVHFVSDSWECRAFSAQNRCGCSRWTFAVIPACFDTKLRYASVGRWLDNQISRETQQSVD